jgi:hypothetical protein
LIRFTANPVFGLGASFRADFNDASLFGYVRTEEAIQIAEDGTGERTRDLPLGSAERDFVARLAVRTAEAQS